MEQSAGKEIDVTITALIDGRWIQYKTFHWQVVSDKIDPYLTYRLIEPDYEIWNNVQIQQRCVENFETNALGHYEQLDNRCMNCHTFANQDPNLSMMYVRGENGGAILNRNGKLSKLNIPGSVYFGFSPSGRYITYSTQQIIPAFHSLASKRLEVFDAKSNVFVADMEQHRIISSPLLSDSLKLETFPTFSPDGKYIYYCVSDSVSLPMEINCNIVWCAFPLTSRQAPSVIKWIPCCGPLLRLNPRPVSAILASRPTAAICSTPLQTMAHSPSGTLRLIYR